MPALPPAYRELIEIQQRRVAKLVKTAGVEPVRKAVEEWTDDVAKRLSKMAPGSSRYSAHIARSMSLQLNVAKARLSTGAAKALGAGSMTAQSTAIRGLATDVSKMEKRFTGSVVPMPILEAARFRGLIDKRRTSLLRAHETSMNRYGANVVGKMERELSLSLVNGETGHQAIDRVMKTADAEWWRAERVVRTEMNWAYSASQSDANAELATEIEDLWSRWTEQSTDDGSPLDDRVETDSLAMHGQVAPPGGLFWQPPTAPDGEEVQKGLVGKSWPHPPNRPNDRAVLTPWRPHWGVPGWVWRGGRRLPVTVESFADIAGANRAPKRTKPAVEAPAKPAPAVTEPKAVKAKAAVKPAAPPVAAQPPAAPPPVAVPAAPVGEEIVVDGKTLRLETKTLTTASGATETHVHVMRTLSDGEQVIAGKAEFLHRGDKLYPREVNVEPLFQRKGVGTKMYKLAEGATGKSVLPSETQTPQGKAFSAKYRGVVEAPPPPPVEVTTPVGFKPQTVRQNVKVDGRWTSQEVLRPFKTELPTHATVDEDAVYVARPSELAKRDLWGNEIHPEHAASIRATWGDDVPGFDPKVLSMPEQREAIAKAKATGVPTQLDPVDIRVMPDGRYMIEDGNHRLLSAAIMDDRPVSIRFKAASASFEPQAGARRIQDRIEGAINPKAAAPVAAPKPVPAAAPKPEPKRRGGKVPIPDGFDLGPLDPKTKIHEGIPTPATIKKFDAMDKDHVTAVDARELLAGDLYEPEGGGWEKLRMDSIRDAFRKGAKLPPVRLIMNADGRMAVDQGRHRLRIAAEQGRKVLVRFSGGTVGTNGMQRFPMPPKVE